MTDSPRTDNVNPLFKLGSFVRRGTTGKEGQQIFLQGGRQADVFYRDRWAFDKVVRSTHGVNCTGSCSGVQAFVEQLSVEAKQVIDVNKSQLAELQTKTGI